MDYRLSVEDLSDPRDLQKLKNAISELAHDLDVLYTETAPNGNISARIGRLAIYNNSGTMETWQNTDGGTTWAKKATDANVVHNSGDEEIAGVKTFTSIPVLPASDATTANQAIRKQQIDDKFNASTGHDHDGSDSKKVSPLDLDYSALTDGHFIKRSGNAIIGVALVILKSAFLVRLTTAGDPAAFDETGGFDSNSNFASNKFTASIAGKYQININIQFNRGNAGSGTTWPVVYLKKGGSRVFEFKAVPGSATAGNYAATVTGSIIVDLVVNDYLELEAVDDNNNYVTVVNDITKSFWSGAYIPDTI